MAFVFHRRLAIPLWVTAFFTVALTAPPTVTLSMMSPATAFAIAALGIGAIVFLTPRRSRSLRTSRAPVRVLARAHHEDLLRMDDDGGRQMARPPA